jgi:hypothetical protein
VSVLVCRTHFTYEGRHPQATSGSLGSEHFRHSSKALFKGEALATFNASTMKEDLCDA